MGTTNRIAGLCVLLALAILAGCEDTKTIKAVDQDKPSSEKQAALEKDLEDAKTALAQCEDDLTKAEAKIEVVTAELDKVANQRKGAAEMSAKLMEAAEQLRHAETQIVDLRKQLAAAKASTAEMQKQKDLAQTELQRFQQAQLKGGAKKDAGEDSELKQFQKTQQQKQQQKKK